MRGLQGQTRHSQALPCRGWSKVGGGGRAVPYTEGKGRQGHLWAKGTHLRDGNTELVPGQGDRAVSPAPTETPHRVTPPNPSNSNLSAPFRRLWVKKPGGHMGGSGGEGGCRQITGTPRQPYLVQ